jgi:CheY-like chemotaxis protein
MHGAHRRGHPVADHVRSGIAARLDMVLVDIMLPEMSAGVLVAEVQKFWPVARAHQPDVCAAAPVA